MMKKDSVAVLFGAAGGLGREIYTKMKEEYSFVLTVDRIPFLESEHHMIADFLNESSLDKVECLLKDKNRIDALVFASGAGSTQPFYQQGLDTLENVIDVNFQKPIEFLHKVSSLVLASRGRVLFIGSTSAFLPSADWLVYSVSKISLDHFCRSLQIEWAGRAHVSILHPGPMKTHMHKNLGMDLKKIGWHKFKSPEWMASEVMVCLKSNKFHRFTPEWKQRLLIKIVFVSSWAWKPLLRKMYAKKNMPDHGKLQGFRASACDDL